MRIAIVLDPGNPSMKPLASADEILTGTNNAMKNTQESKGKNIVEAINLRSILISLLMKKPDGMTLKALEKAVKEVVPNLKKKINPIVRKIASYKYPGRSPNHNHPQLSAHQEFRDETPAPKGVIKENVTEDGLEEHLSKTLENINGQRSSPDIFEGKKGPYLSEGQEDNSSDGGSDNDTESGGRSKGTVERGSGSDSENGASSNSEEVLYEGVDVVTSYDERECKNKTKVSTKRVFSLVPANIPDLQYETHGKQHNNESDAVR
ncbi:hypothetical protein Lal_00043985 [Lupinus albus]|nr:hypothetical protein Lal_00043985 [Lupinus albus]